jgi:hypothetical protein
MFRTFVFVSTLALGCVALADDDTAAGAPAQFPLSWVGHWTGPAALVAPGRPSREFAMELIVAPTADPQRFTWTVVYAELDGKRQERAYELVVRDTEKGQYAIDEKNGIVIPATLFDSALYTSFEVQGVRINTREALENAGTPEECIRVEMVSGSAQQPEITGGKDAIPEVRSVVARTLQRATLKRRPPEVPKP